MTTTKNLLVELLVEELPPKSLKKLGESFAEALAASLMAQGLVASDAAVTAYATPRRLAVHITDVAAQAADRPVLQKLMPVSIGLDANGQPTPALLKKLFSLGVSASVVPALKRENDGKVDVLFLDTIIKGRSLLLGLKVALRETYDKLPIPKVMTYPNPSRDGWETVDFVRPAHSLVVLHGDGPIKGEDEVSLLGLKTGNATQGHRFEAKANPIVIKDADSYEAQMESEGAVIPSFEKRRAEIARQLAAAASKVGGGVTAIDDDALLDEVTALVERPNVLICKFEKEFLDVPQECLILTMKANQKYFPLLDAAGKLTNQFLVVSNITPMDASAVIGGNERVVRARLADAKFFFDQDRKKTLASRVAGLDKVVYHNKLGSQGERVARVRAIAKAIGQQLGGDALAQKADQAAMLAKTDLVTDMVGEFPELQGTMGRYYALNDGLSLEVADAIEDHYKPRFAGDTLPRNEVGVVVALADKLETLVGMFGIGNLPTGDKDPFALRRHALGVIRMLVEKDLPLELNQLLDTAFELMKRVEASGLMPSQPLKGTFAVGSILFNLDPNTPTLLADFFYDRFAGSLREQGYSAQEVDAVLALHPQRLGDVPKRLAAVRAFAALPEAAALAAANKRISNILKKAQEVDSHVSEVLLKESAEVALYAALRDVVPKANAQFEAGDYTASLQTLAALRAPVDAFFDDVMVNAEEMDLRLNRQGLLKALHNAMNRVADLSKLAT